MQRLPGPDKRSSRSRLLGMGRHGAQQRPLKERHPRAWSAWWLHLLPSCREKRHFSVLLFLKHAGNRLPASNGSQPLKSLGKQNLCGSSAVYGHPLLLTTCTDDTVGSPVHISGWRDLFCLEAFRGKNRPQYLLDCITRVKIARDKYLCHGHRSMSSAWSDQGSCRVWVAPGKGKSGVQQGSTFLQVTETLWR